ncbi:MAG TPA: hypothetical protein VFM18_19095 [Methanosarcina sp.]|nr:hypothetical protein [Methanosarcina sp.]
MDELKNPVYTDIITNPMHQYASWSYALSLWWMDIDDFNTLMNMPDVNEALSYDLVSQATNSYVIAEDSGLFPDRRHPLINGLIYNLQNLEITTFIAPTPSAGCTNQAHGKFTIVEPYGVTLINVLAEAAYDKVAGVYNSNYIDRPFILQVDFVGYDDAGNEVPRDQTALYRKRFPITISEIKLDVGMKGAEYHCSFLPRTHELYWDKEASTTPKTFNIVANTIEEFFNGPQGLAKQLNEYQQYLVGGKNDWGDRYSFDIDKAIGNSSIVNPNETTYVNSNPNTDGFDASKKIWSIPRGTAIQDIITKIMSHSSYLIDQLGLEGKKTVVDDQTAIIKMFKVLSLISHEGISLGGDVYKGVYDHRRNKYARSYNLKIVQVPTWLGCHPALSQFSDPRRYCTKAYSYLYTGENIDIINWQLNFDPTYFVPVLAYPFQRAAATPNASVKVDAQAQNVPQVNVTPSLISQLYPSLGKVKVATPLVTKAVVDNQNVTTGFGIGSRPASVVVADAINSTLYDHQSSMMNLTVEIIGDPTMLKQDEWVYTPSPNKSVNYYNWDVQSQSDFVLKYGHLRLDMGEIIVSFVVNTPVDIDTDYVNEGLMAPDLKSIPALFNGYYNITSIDSKFINGKFTQTLSMNRYQNIDYIATAEPIKANVNTNFTASIQNRDDPTGLNALSQPISLSVSVPLDQTSAAIAQANNLTLSNPASILGTATNPIPNVR